MTEKKIEAEYLKLLSPWMKHLRQNLYRPPGRPDLCCYGTGYDNWGVQTHQKAFAACAVLAGAPVAADPDLLDITLQMLRFNLESHLKGSWHCTDNNSWGHTWISVLGLERMMHGIEAIREHLTEQDHVLLREVLVSEARWLLDNYTIVAGKIQNNKPESNIWNGAFLYRVVQMYPDLLGAEEMLDKGSAFLLNGISIDADAMAETVVDGKAIKDRFVGANFFDSFACNHHGYLNVGYMVICLSNVAMLHFSCRQFGWTPPAALYHHVEELWRLVKACTFPDGRLLRIGGDTRVRYCYCQDYAIPMWLLMQDLGIDDCSAFERGWLEQIQRETAVNADNTFLSTRCCELRQKSTLYFTRLESDRAASLSMGAYWHRLMADMPLSAENPWKLASGGGPDALQTPICEVRKARPAGQAVMTVADKDNRQANTSELFQWHDEYHGASFIRGPRRAVSWVWRAAEPPAGLCLPLDDSSLAEWYHNAGGELETHADFDCYEVSHFQQRTFDSGFLTWGTLNAKAEGFVGEGQQQQAAIAEQQIVYAALPDDRTAVVLQLCTAMQRIFLKSCKGLFYLIPNDIFNGMQRQWFAADSCRTLTGIPDEESLIKPDSEWLNVDNRLGFVKLYGKEPLCIHRSPERQISLAWAKKKKVEGMLAVDEVCIGCHTDPTDHSRGDILMDLGAVLVAGTDAAETSELHRKIQTKKDAFEISTSSRAVFIPGANGILYLLTVNFGAKAEFVIAKCHLTLQSLSEPGRIFELVGGSRLEIAPDSAELWEVS